MGKRKLFLLKNRKKNVSYFIDVLDSSETMNTNQSRSINTSHERNVPENYPYSSYEHLSSNKNYAPSSSYSSTAYQYPPPPSYSNNNNNRHSLNPTTSDDSGNESTINYHKKMNQHFVVVAIDFGTTFSGYAFAFTRDIDSILMMRKVDGNDPG